MHSKPFSDFFKYHKRLKKFPRCWMNLYKDFALLYEISMVFTKSLDLGRNLERFVFSLGPFPLLFRTLKGFVDFDNRFFHHFNAFRGFLASTEIFSEGGFSEKPMFLDCRELYGEIFHCFVVNYA